MTRLDALEPLAVVPANLNGTFRLGQAAFRAIKSQRRSDERVINNGSICAHTV
jgi:NAD(P)-dependent dehydrogenase (short-subunit alcohol dehydrogenase family)